MATIARRVASSNVGQAATTRASGYRPHFNLQDERFDRRKNSSRVSKLALPNQPARYAA
jgi:hypothetical protein